MSFFRDYADYREFWLFVLAVILVSGLGLTVVWVNAVQDFPQVGASAQSVSTTIHDGKKVAALIASNHYMSPDYNEVYRHTGTVDALNDYLRTLDPYSKYFISKQARFFAKRNQGSRLGIGLDFMIKGDRILGVPVAQGPVYKAGMKLPAYVHSVNGSRIKYSDFSSYSFLTDFPAGRMVRLVLEDDGRLVKTHYALKVAEYKTDPISHYSNSDVLFVRIKKFVGGENGRLRRILNTSNQYRKLVLDLRYCPGGDVYAMTGVLSFLLKEGLDVAFLVKADDTRGRSLRTVPGRVINRIPIYLLVSEFTASSAELFSRALKQNYPLVQVLGRPTKGKCLAQETFELPDGSALKLTAYEVKDSSRRSCEGIPIIPDRMIQGIITADSEELLNTVNGRSDLVR